MDEMQTEEYEFIDNQETEDDFVLQSQDNFGDIVLGGTDWTVETVLNQIMKGNIKIDPSFQRRGAWDIKRKSRFIESLILNIPIPQIILAEDKNKKGKYIVIDGKQRLLTLAQFSGFDNEAFPAFKLKNLEVKKNLNNVSYETLKNDEAYIDDITRIENSTIQTIVIRSWKDEKLLHLIFLRLNTGSTPLSPQELRKALHPGPFTDFVDEKSIGSTTIHEMLNIKEADSRMRDAELILRYFAFTMFLQEYDGDLKSFLDSVSNKLNEKWIVSEKDIEDRFNNLENAISVVRKIFGKSAFRRFNKDKYDYKFNRAVFDIMIFYFRDKNISELAEKNHKGIKKLYENICTNDASFAESIEAGTRDAASLHKRIRIWGDALKGLLPDVSKILVENLCPVELKRD